MRCLNPVPQPSSPHLTATVQTRPPTSYDCCCSGLTRCVPVAGTHNGQALPLWCASLITSHLKPACVECAGAIAHRQRPPTKPCGSHTMLCQPVICTVHTTHPATLMIAHPTTHETLTNASYHPRSCHGRAANACQLAHCTTPVTPRAQLHILPQPAPAECPGQRVCCSLVCGRRRARLQRPPQLL